MRVQVKWYGERDFTDVENSKDVNKETRNVFDLLLNRKLNLRCLDVLSNFEDNNEYIPILK